MLQSLDAGKAFAFAEAAETSPVKNDSYAYGDVAVVQAHVGKMHVLRVWVKRPVGWRALVYQETRSLDALPAAAVGAAPLRPRNPCGKSTCGTLPYQPKNEAEKGVLASYMALEATALAHNAPEWSRHVADEFVAASSNSNVLLDKPTRIKGLESEKMAGLAPTALVSARMFDFPNAVVMISVHKTERGSLIHITRVWVMRDGSWLETLSVPDGCSCFPSK